MTSCLCCRPAIVAKSIHNEGFASPSRALNRVAGVVPYGTNGRSLSLRFRGVRASAVDSYESSSDFVNRMEKAWLISKVILINHIFQNFSFNIGLCCYQLGVVLFSKIELKFNSYVWESRRSINEWKARLLVLMNSTFGWLVLKIVQLPMTQTQEDNMSVNFVFFK